MVMMDNCSVHKVKEIRRMIIEVFNWALVFNEAYKPQFMPIRKFFANLKREYHKVLLLDRKIYDNSEIKK